MKARNSIIISLSKRRLSAILIIAFILVLILLFCGCSTNYKQYVDELAEKNVSDINDIVKSESYSSGVEEYATKVGAFPASYEGKFNDLIINEEFFSEYIDSYGASDLLNHYYAYFMCSPDPEFYNSEAIKEANNRAAEMKSTLIGMPEYQSLEIVSFNGAEIESMHGSDGYYGNKKDISLKDKVYGEFNDASKDNEVYSSSRENTKEYSFYGDWMVVHDSGSHYDGGSYGWYGGQFIDEPATWENYNNYSLYYKGNEMINVPADSIADVSYDFILTDKRVFFWSGNTLCRGGKLVDRQFTSCESFFQGFEDYLNEYLPDGKYTIKKGEILANKEATAIKMYCTVDSEVVYYNDELMDLPPDGVDITKTYFYPNSEDEETYNLYYAFLAYADGSTEGLEGGKKLFDQLFSLIDYDKSFSQSEGVDLQSGNRGTIFVWVDNPIDKKLSVGITYTGLY